MTRLTTLPYASRWKPSFKGLADFNFRVLAGRVLMTNGAGSYADLKLSDFRRFVEGRMKAEDPVHRELARKGFVRGSAKEELADRYRNRNAFLWHAPLLHIIVVSLRCNHKCLYCHASVVGPHQTELDMTVETARKTVDFIFQTPSPSLMIEFQGGEPLINWAVVEAITHYARARAKEEGRRVILCMVSNFSMMDEEKLRFLQENGVSLCTSLDGPEELHNHIRIFREGDSHKETLRWLTRLLEPFSGGRRAPDGVNRPGALLTVTRQSLPHYKEIVDSYVKLGLSVIYLRPLSAIGFARRVWGKIGYTADEFVAFYRNAMDVILDLNARGTPLVEQSTRIMLEKILRSKDPGFVDMRSPAGGGLGVLAYNYNGDVYSSDEGRMLAQDGNERFRMGHVGQPYREVVGQSSNKEWAMASTLELQPMCAQCAYRPYCGVCPVANAQTQGSVWGQMPSSSRCRTSMGIFDYLFEKLRDPAARRILESWVEPES